MRLVSSSSAQFYALYRELVWCRFASRSCSIAWNENCAAYSFHFLVVGDMYIYFRARHLPHWELLCFTCMDICKEFAVLGAFMFYLFGYIHFAVRNLPYWELLCVTLICFYICSRFVLGVSVFFSFQCGA